MRTGPLLRNPVSKESPRAEKVDHKKRRTESQSKFHLGESLTHLDRPFVMVVEADFDSNCQIELSLVWQSVGRIECSCHDLFNSDQSRESSIENNSRKTACVHLHPVSLISHI